MSGNARSIFQRLSQHRAWVNENLLAAAANLDHQQLQRVFPIGQGSVWKSLVHMYAAEYVWLEALYGNEDGCCPGDAAEQLPGNQLGEGAIQSLAELRDKWAALERRWADYFAALQDEALDEPVSRISRALGGQRFVSRRSDVHLHVCLHAQYTAAQVVNMLRQLGLETFPKTMLMSMIWEEIGRAR
jgi:uncharacterized damage-inducible protein DinB